MGNFVEEQKAVNVQLTQCVEEHKAMNVQANQRINIMESTLNSRMDGLQNEMDQKFDTLQCSISRLTNQLQVQEKGKFPSQTQPYPRGVHEFSSSNEPSSRIDEVKVVITLRSDKEVKQPVPKPAEEVQEAKEAEPEKEVIKENVVKRSTTPPFPQALKAKKKAINQAEILEVLRQVKVNIPLLDMIKQVPTYAKFLKDLCIVKRGLNVDKKVFLT